MGNVFMVTFEWCVENDKDIEIELFDTYDKAFTRFNEIVQNELNPDLSWVGDEAFDENGKLRENFSLDSMIIPDGEQELRWYLFDNDNNNRYSLIDLKFKKIK